LERSAEAKKKVVQLRPKPEPGRRHEVKCPMCETVGYTGRKAAGMDVKCANPNCTFPFFTAPPLDEADEEPGEKSTAEGAAEPAKKSLVTRERIIAYSLIGVVSIVALWFFAFRKPTRPKPSNGGSIPRSNPLVNGGPKTPVVPHPEKQPVKPKLRDELLTIRKNALQLMITQSGLANPLSGMKPLAWQWTVDAHARAGKFDAAKELMQQLRVVTRDGRFYQSLPLIATAWKRLERGRPEDAAAAKEAVDAALAAAKDLPQRSRQSYDIAAELAAVLIATGRAAEAEEKIAGNSDAVDEAQASLFADQVRFLENDDAEAAVQNDRLARSKSPQRVAVTLLLAGHGHWKQAWDWVKSQSAGPVRDDCAIAWAEMRFGSRQMPIASKAKPSNDGKQPAKDPRALPDLDAVAAVLSGPAPRGTLYARVAFRLQHHKKPDEARAVLANARDALASIKPATEPKPPAVKDVSTYAATAETERQSRAASAAALAELARAELRNDPQAGKAAWTALFRAIAVVRSIAPSPVAVARLVNDARVGNDRVARSQLARITGLEGDDLNKRVIRHREDLKPINDAATFRFDLQQRLLVAAANWGGYTPSRSPAILKLVWKDIEPRTQKDYAGGQEDWYATRVPWLLAGNAELAGDSQLVGEILPKLARRTLLSRRQFRWGEFQNAMRNKDYGGAAEKLSDLKLDANWVNRMVLAQTSRFANAGELDSGKRFIRGLRDRLLKMEALNLLAARATALGNVKAVWAAIGDGVLDSPQKVAMCHGLIAALIIPSAEPEPKKQP
jgi:hypothetical protein